jgi:PAS domain S-box-containing protein
VAGTPFDVPNPASLMGIIIAGGAAAGGWIPGLISAAIAFAYAIWYFADPGHPFVYTAENLRKIQVLAFTLPSLALIVGWMRARTTRAVLAASQAAAAKDLSDVLDHAQDAVFMADADSRFFHVNAAACALTGYPEAELLGMHAYDLLDRTTLPPGFVPGEALARDGRSLVQLDLCRKGGGKVTVDVRASRLADGRTVAIIRDVTAQVRVVNELREALALVNATLDSTADGILVVDRCSHVVRSNERFARMWNIDKAVLATGDDSALLDSVRRQLRDPDAFFEKVQELYSRPDAESFDTVEFLDGRVFERYSLPHRIDGDVVGRVWSFRDVTAARQQAAALRESESRFLQAQKLEAIGRLAGGVAHDFNNMLTAILGESELLLLQLPPGSPLKEQVEHIRTSAQRSAGLTRQLLAFGRRENSQPRAFSLLDVVQGVEPLLRRLAGPTIVFRIEPATLAPWVFADPGQIEQALINLVINAHDAMPDGGLLTVRIGAEDVAETERARRGARRGGPHGWFEVTDTGEGIPEHVRPHLFEPFFTTKSPGKGTGLGLASVYGVVEQSGGFIEVDSRVGEGATFRVLVPAIAPPMMPPMSPPMSPPLSAPNAQVPSSLMAHPPEPGAHRATVLLAEDEGAVRTFVAAVLRQLGYLVLEAESGEAALALSHRHEGVIDLLLTDVVMPGINGPELAMELEHARPGIRIVLMSGYAGDALVGLGVKANGFAMLLKPFGSDALARIVSETLAAQTPR